MYSETPDVFDKHTGQSATHEIMNRMELFGALPPSDEIDHRPMPDLDNGETALDIMFDSMRDILSETCLEGETPDLLWNIVNVFQRKLNRLDKGFDLLGFELCCFMRERWWSCGLIIKT